MPADTEWVEVARGVAPRIRERAGETEGAGRVPRDLVDDLADLGLFRLWLPDELGGVSADFRTTIEVVEELSRADGSTGWVAMIGMTTALITGYLDPAVASEVYGPDRRVVTGGVVAPGGQARRVDGGFVVDGRWPFASGCQHCSWLVGGTIVMGQDGAEMLPSGMPEVRLMLFPSAEVEIIENWDVIGLRGTGSHDITASAVFVPEARSLSLLAPIRFRPEAHFGMPIPTPLAIALAAVPLGIARGALDDIVVLAGEKTPSMSVSTLAKRAVVQIEVAEADSELRAAHALLLDASDRLWDVSSAGRPPSDHDRAVARGAAVHAVTTAASVVDRAYTMAGGTSLRRGSTLERRFRDVHAATQHAIVSRGNLELIGRVLLGLPTDASAL